MTPLGGEGVPRNTQHARAGNARTTETAPTLQGWKLPRRRLTRRFLRHSGADLWNPERRTRPAHVGLAIRLPRWFV